MIPISNKEVIAWKNRVKTAQSFRDGENDKRKDEMERHVAYLRNEFKLLEESMGKTDDLVPVNDFHWILRTLGAFLYFKNPKVFITSLTPMFELGAKKTEMWINGKWRKLAQKKEMRAVVRDGIVYGLGVFKTGYSSLFLERLKPKEEESKGIGGVIRGVVEKVIPGAGKAIKKPKGIEWKESENVKASEIVGVRISPRNLLVDFRGLHGDFSRCNWVGEERFVPIEVLKANPNFSNTKDLHPDSKIMPEDIGLPKDEDLGVEDREGIWIYELHLKDPHRVLILTDQIDEPLFYDPPYEPGAVEGFPYVPLAFNPVNDQFWPESEFLYQEQKILERSKIRTQMIRMIKKNIPLLGSRKPLTPDQKSQFENMGLGELIEGIPKGDIYTIQELFQVPQDFYAIERLLAEDERRELGLIGTDVPSTKTATTTIEFVHEAKTNLDDMKGIVADFAAEIAKKQLMQQKAHGFKDKEFIRVGKEGMKMFTEDFAASKVNPNLGWVPFTPKDIPPPDGIEVVVEVGSTAPLGVMREERASRNLLIIGKYFANTTDERKVLKWFKDESGINADWEKEELPPSRSDLIGLLEQQMGLSGNGQKGRDFKGLGPEDRQALKESSPGDSGDVLNDGG